VGCTRSSGLTPKATKEQDVPISEGTDLACDTRPDFRGLMRRILPSLSRCAWIQGTRRSGSNWACLGTRNLFQVEALYREHPDELSGHCLDPGAPQEYSHGVLIHSAAEARTSRTVHASVPQRRQHARVPFRNGVADAFRYGHRLARRFDVTVVHPFQLTRSWVAPRGAGFCQRQRVCFRSRQWDAGSGESHLCRAGGD
jgi:hypothetical protein